MDKDYLILKRASASRLSGEWSEDDYDVLADGLVVGRILKAAAAPIGTPWLWTLAFGHHEDRTPIYGYEPTREAAMAAFAKSWRRGSGQCPLSRVKQTGLRDDVCLLLTQSGQRPDRNPAMQQSATYRCAIFSTEKSPQPLIHLPRGDLGSQRGEEPNTHYRSSFEDDEGENSR